MSHNSENTTVKIYDYNYIFSYSKHTSYVRNNISNLCSNLFSCMPSKPTTCKSIKNKYQWSQSFKVIDNNFYNDLRSRKIAL